jgi:PIN domain nuclease of toxin-antitoxin system
LRHIESRHRSLRLPDALVLAMAEVEDADVITADQAWTRYGDRVEVVA